MSIFEYDKELEEKKLRKAEYEAGFSDGEKSGHETGFSEGHKSGFSEGRESGFSEGQNHAAIEQIYDRRDCKIFRFISTGSRNYFF